jgi:hypothetical protein
MAKHNKTMDKKIDMQTILMRFMFVFVLVLSIQLVSAELTHKQNTDLKFSMSSNFADECVLTTINTPTNVLFINQNGTKTSQTFNFTISSSNFATVGNYRLNIECSDATDKVTEYESVTVTLSGVERNMPILLADIVLIFLISVVIFLLHNKYQHADYKESNNKIGESHDGNWGKTFIKTLGNNLMRNSFLWYYSLGWLLLIVLKDLVYNFSATEIYSFFLLCLDIYSFGFFLIIVVWIGILIHHFRFITELINDLNLGVSSK